MYIFMLFYEQINMPISTVENWMLFIIVNKMSKYNTLLITVIRINATAWEIFPLREFFENFFA